MTVNEFLNVFMDASVSIQLIHNDSQAILANGSKLQKGAFTKFLDKEVKTIRLDSWIREGRRMSEIELGIRM